MANVLRHLASRHGLFLAVIVFFLGGFEFLICAIVGSVDVGGALQQLMRTLPPAIQAMINEQLFGLSARGFVAFGWNHPIAHALGTAAAIVLASRAVAGEIEDGLMELLLSHPMSRSAYLFGHIVFAGLALIALTLAGIAGTVFGQSQYSLEQFEPEAFFKLGIAFFSLQMAWYAFTLAFSAAGHEGGRTASLAFIIALASYFIQLIGRFWSPAGFLVPFSLHNYYSPQTILLEQILDLKSLGVLVVFIGLCLSFSFWYFRRRDIP